jgi:hypothetical protein
VRKPKRRNYLPKEGDSAVYPVEEHLQGSKPSEGNHFRPASDDKTGSIVVSDMLLLIAILAESASNLIVGAPQLRYVGTTTIQAAAIRG